MRVFINAVSAKGGGATTYLRNVLPELVRLARVEGDEQVVVWGGGDGWSVGGLKGWIEFRRPRSEEMGGLGRLFFDQVELPRAVRRERCEVLFSSANFGSLFVPCRQVLLVRNAILFSGEYYSRMTQRQVRWRIRFLRRLCLASIRRADHVLFPSQAMMEMVSGYTGGALANWSVAPYGVRSDLRPSTGESMEPPGPGSPVRILFVSHYSEQKNVGTLLRAFHLLSARAPGRYHLDYVGLFTGLDAFAYPDFPRLAEDQHLFHRLQALGEATDHGPVPYDALPSYYHRAHVFAFPSYVESFGHPLLEALAAGNPVVAADSAVNREICGDAALYFDTFSAESLAEVLEGIVLGGRTRHILSKMGVKRAAGFSWADHARSLLNALRGCRQGETSAQTGGQGRSGKDG